MKKDKKLKKARSKVQATIDLTYPVDFDFTKFGGPEDPCFGKLFDPKDAICQGCGDAEICQIYLAQQNHVKRLQIEEKGHFRDIEEKQIYDNKPSIKDIKADIRRTIRKHKKINIQDLITQISGKFNLPEKKVNGYITKMVSITDKFTLKNNDLIWKN